jgi:hypothetical protein
MTTETSLWGTFSVIDHTRHQPFIADVLLYDRLVIPVPNGPDEVERWRGLHRDPDLQNRLLDIVGDLAVKIPWSLQLHDTWAKQYAEDDAPGDGSETDVRDGVAQAVEFDANNIEMARRNSPPPGQQSQAAGNPDDPAFMLTRMVLADEIGSRKDQALLAGIPRADEVKAVVAYGSYSRFKADRGTLSREPATGGQPVLTFGWPFLVPSDSHRTDDDLLREAVELAHADEIAEWRAAVQRWQRNAFIEGKSDVEARTEMEELMRQYAAAARKRQIRLQSRWAFAVSAAAAGAAAVAFPPLGIPAALFGLGALLPSGKMPKNLSAAAMFHEASRRLS